MEAQTIEGSLDSSLGPFQNDLLLAHRYSWNDKEGTEIFTGVIVDLDDSKDILGSLEFKQRIFDEWTTKLSLRVIEASSGDEGLRNLEKNDHVSLWLSRHF